MFIKLCGMYRDCDIDYVNETAPDYVGFVINVPKSHRNVDISDIKSLSDRVRSDIKKVGVFVNEDIEIVSKLLCDNIIDIAQLHGDEDDEYISRLKSLTDREVWKVYELGSIAEERDKLYKVLDKARNSKADKVLFDSGKGSGKTFDRHILDDFDKEYILAGGLTPENIAELEAPLPYAVDLSSGIETDKKKDLEKMLRAVKTAKNVTRVQL